MSGRPFEQDDPSLPSIRAYKGVVLTDERRNTIHDYLDLGQLEVDGFDDNRSMENESLEERLAELDRISLPEYPYRIDLHVAILADPGCPPDEWADNIKMYVEDALSDVPCVVESSDTSRDNEDSP